jgi:hypothetical protein
VISSLFLSLTILDAILLWAICAKGWGYWGLKLAAILVVVGLNFTVIHYRVTGTGWPTPNEPPRKSIFAGCHVVEPQDQSDPSTGAIYLWLIPQKHYASPFGYSSIPDEPRGYKLPYDRDLHKQCVEATTQSRQQGAAPVAVHRSGRSNKPGKFVFYALPPPIPQEKGKP